MTRRRWGRLAPPWKIAVKKDEEKLWADDTLVSVDDPTLKTMHGKGTGFREPVPFHFHEAAWNIYFLPILNILVPQTGQTPCVAGFPFFIVMLFGLFISLLVRHFIQYACIKYLLDIWVSRLIHSIANVIAAFAKGVRLFLIHRSLLIFRCHGAVYQ